MSFRRGALSWRAVIAIAPGLLVFGVLFILPVSSLMWSQLAGREGILAMREILKSAAFQVSVVETLEISVWVTVISVALGYPIALFLVRGTRTQRILLLFAVVLPLCSSFLTRAFALQSLLIPSGPIIGALQHIGFSRTPVLMYNRVGTIIGMVYALMPYFIVISLMAMNRLVDLQLENVARTLGASRLVAFFHTTLPLSLPGVFSGGAIVFALSSGFYVTPALLGGREDRMLAILVEQQVHRVLNWERAAAISFMLFFLFLTTIVLGWLAVGVVLRRPLARQ